MRSLWPQLTQAVAFQVIHGHQLQKNRYWHCQDGQIAQKSHLFENLRQHLIDLRQTYHVVLESVVVLVYQPLHQKAALLLLNQRRAQRAKSQDGGHAVAHHHKIEVLSSFEPSVLHRARRYLSAHKFYGPKGSLHQHHSFVHQQRLLAINGHCQNEKGHHAFDNFLILLINFVLCQFRYSRSRQIQKGHHHLLSFLIQHCRAPLK